MSRILPTLQVFTERVRTQNPKKARAFYELLLCLLRIYNFDEDEAKPVRPLSVSVLMPDSQLLLEGEVGS